MLQEHENHLPEHNANEQPGSAQEEEEYIKVKKSDLDALRQRQDQMIDDLCANYFFLEKLSRITESVGGDPLEAAQTMLSSKRRKEIQEIMGNSFSDLFNRMIKYQSYAESKRKHQSNG